MQKIATMMGIVFLGSIAVSCMHQGRGYRTSSIAEALVVSAELAVSHPEMVEPRSDKKQKKMENDADLKLGVEVVPEDVFVPYLFIPVE